MGDHLTDRGMGEAERATEEKALAVRGRAMTGEEIKAYLDSLPPEQRANLLEQRRRVQKIIKDSREAEQSENLRIVQKRQQDIIDLFAGLEKAMAQMVAALNKFGHAVADTVKEAREMKLALREILVCDAATQRRRDSKGGPRQVQEKKEGG